jgi:hypothetical protein
MVGQDMKEGGRRGTGELNTQLGGRLLNSWMELILR